LRKKSFSARGYAEIHIQRPFFDNKNSTWKILGLKIRILETCSNTSSTRRNFYFWKTLNLNFWWYFKVLLVADLAVLGKNCYIDSGWEPTQSKAEIFKTHYSLTVNLNATPLLSAWKQLGLLLPWDGASVVGLQLQFRAQEQHSLICTHGFSILVQVASHIALHPNLHQKLQQGAIDTNWTIWGNSKDSVDGGIRDNSSSSADCEGRRSSTWEKEGSGLPCRHDC
jgi:hypothetical protein